jgi:hypothetical protein
VVLAAILAALAVLTKQTQFAAGLAGFVWLLLHERRMAALFAGISLGLVLITSAAMQLSTHAFLDNVVFVHANALNSFVLQFNLGVLVQYQAAVLAIAAIYLLSRLRDWRKAAGDILVLYALTSLVSLIELAHVGSNYNYWIELGAIAAILATQVIWGGLRWGPIPSGVIAGVAVCVLGAHLAVFLRDVHPSLELLGIIPAEQRRDLRQPAEFDWVIGRVRQEPGEVLSEAMDVVVLAGRPTVVEPLIFTQMVDSDQWDDGPLVRQICAGDVGLLLLKGPLEGGTPGEQYLRSAEWPPRVLEALRETMQLETRQSGLWVYRWDSSAAPGPVCAGARAS